MTSLDEPRRLLRTHGLKITGQRLAVCAVLTAGQHLTAEAVHERARAVLPSLSLATVYKVLNELHALAAVRRVDLGDGAARFDANTAPHAHLICRQCGRIADLPAEDYHVGLPAVARRGFDEIEAAVLFHGRCAACQSPSADLTPSVSADKQE